MDHLHDLSTNVEKLISLLGTRLVAILICTFLGAIQAAVISIILWLIVMERTIHFPPVALQWVASIGMGAVVALIPTMIWVWWRLTRLRI